MRNHSRKIALGGMMAALAVVIMSLGGLIPIATFVCPMLCMLLLAFVSRMCGNRIGWAWYGAVAILSLLLGPDKEAAAVFVFLGFYPIIKPRMDRMKLSRLWKLLLFNVLILAMYALLIHMFGLEQIAAERDDILIGKIDVDQEMELAMQFGITSIPTLILMKNGEVAATMVGYRPKADILKLLDA